MSESRPHNHFTANAIPAHGNPIPWQQFEAECREAIQQWIKAQNISESIIAGTQIRFDRGNENDPPSIIIDPPYFPMQLRNLLDQLHKQLGSQTEIYECPYDSWRFVLKGKPGTTFADLFETLKNACDLKISYPPNLRLEEREHIRQPNADHHRDPQNLADGMNVVRICSPSMRHNPAWEPFCKQLRTHIIADAHFNHDISSERIQCLLHVEVKEKTSLQGPSITISLASCGTMQPNAEESRYLSSLNLAVKQAAARSLIECRHHFSIGRRTLEISAPPSTNLSELFQVLKRACPELAGMHFPYRLQAQEKWKGAAPSPAALSVS